MLIRGATETEIRLAVERTPGVAFGYRTLSDRHGAGPVSRGKAYRVKLVTEGRPPRYGRVSTYAGRNGKRRRLPGCLCWHGFRDFFRSLYAIAPGAVVVTGLATYRGREHFEATFEATGDWNAGSMYAPCAMRDSCNCVDGEPVEPEMPPCVRAMRCYCAGHARGLAASEPCDTREVSE